MIEKLEEEHKHSFGTDWECSRCGTVISEELALTGHIYADVWTGEASGHFHARTACGKRTEAEAHRFAWVTDKPATTAEDGVKHEECTLCGYKQKEGTVIGRLPQEPTLLAL